LVEVDREIALLAQGADLLRTLEATQQVTLEDLDPVEPSLV
jgi:hypothetical protein